MSDGFHDKVESRMARLTTGWVKKFDYWQRFYKTYYMGKVFGYHGDHEWQWQLFDENMHVTANGYADSPEEGMRKCDSAAASRGG